MRKQKAGILEELNNKLLREKMGGWIRGMMKLPDAICDFPIGRRKAGRQCL
jgi:hypothetical protein